VFFAKTESKHKIINDANGVSVEIRNSPSLLRIAAIHHQVDLVRSHVSAELCTHG